MIMSVDYLGESNVLKYFDNVRHNSVSSNVFAELMKVTKLTVSCNAEFA